MKIKFLVLLLSLVLGFFPLHANDSNDAFSALRYGFAHGDEVPGSEGMLTSSFAEEQKGDGKDELEPEYDAYLDAPNYPRFSPQSEDQLLQSLGANFRDGNDPYAEEYAKKDPLTRFPELQYRDDRYWVFDNYRATRLVGKKGETLEDGTSRKKNEVEIRWTSAIVDTHKLKKVYWIMTTFNTKIGPLKVKTGHAQLYFEFEDGGVRTPMGNFNSLVNSYEGFRDKGTIFNPTRGMMNSYESIFVMGSFEDVCLKALMVFNGVDIYELDLSREEAKTVLLKSLAISNDREYLATKKYHTTRNSCVTNQVRLINSGLAKERRIKEWHKFLGFRLFRTLGSILPSQIPRTLKKSKLMKSEAHFTGRKNIVQLYEHSTKSGGYPSGDTKFQELYSD